jgi:hypothetical protein
VQQRSLRQHLASRVFALAAAFVAVSSVAHAGPITFSADGTSATTASIQTLNFSAGEALAVGAISGGSITTSPFTLYYQTVLSSVTLANGTQSNPTGLNSTYQITEVAKFQEVATIGSGGSTVTFAQAPGSTSTVNIYYTSLTGGNSAANLATGTGFIAANSTLIMSETITSENSNFTDLTKAGVAPATALSTGSYGGNTDVGVGSSGINLSVGAYNTAFFNTPGIALSTFNTYQNTPFQFALSAGLTFQSPTGGTVTPSTGANNGTSGPDFLLQINGNQAFAVVPEPASALMTVIGLGTAGIGAFAAKRRLAKKA